MDLLDFEGQDLYFDEPLPIRAADLLRQAADAYGEGPAELLLMRAGLQAPEHLSVLVALYRFYYYQHRYEDALLVAERVLELAGRRLKFPPDWRTLDERILGGGVMHSMGLVRFYLLALKAAGYLELRLSRPAEGRLRLRKVVTLDSADRLGARALLETVDDALGMAAQV
jgi:hypothetical protein